MRGDPRRRRRHADPPAEISSDSELAVLLALRARRKADGRAAVVAALLFDTVAPNNVLSDVMREDASRQSEREARVDETPTECDTRVHLNGRIGGVHAMVLVSQLAVAAEGAFQA